MKYILPSLLVVAITGCSSPEQNKEQATQQEPETAVQAENNPVKTEKEEETSVDQTIDNSKPKIIKSSFNEADAIEMVAELKAKLTAIHQRGVFTPIHQKLLAKLDSKQKNYFHSNPHYELLSVSKGDIFLDGNTDFAYVVFDSKKERTSILLYRESTKQHAELFHDIPVDNGLVNANCPYGVFGTLDYQLGSEIADAEDYLVKSMQEFIQNPIVRVDDIVKDDRYYLDSGCFSKRVSKSNTANSLSISTSFVYNNWEALRYNPKVDNFIIYYGQAFAD